MHIPAIRNCDADPTRLERVVHRRIPVRVSVPICPFRVVQEPWVREQLVMYSRVTRWHQLPRAGGLEDQREADLQALEVLDEEVRRMKTPQSIPRPEGGG